MAESGAQQEEPTMEEILASIRRIISEDADQPADAANGRAKEPAAEPSAEEAAAEAAAEPEYAEEPAEIFQGEAEAESMSEPTTEPADEEVLELTDVAAEAAGAPEPAEAAAESIVSDDVAVAASAKFDQLSHMLVRRYPGAENTLEGLVRDLLRPLLKEWLDANLPPLVEEMVAREIERITRGKSRS
ncbi:MAG: DUF2497 domain-containing protein [Alphaproteobacteria bacterium]|nr:MAG: DUF2497 domain-containing protein [Alphaproteobacteria bacterium]